MRRLVEPEWLDALPPEDPRAQRSRQDLQRINWWMAHLRILNRALTKSDARLLGVGFKSLLLEYWKQQINRMRHWFVGAPLARSAPPAWDKLGHTPQRIVELGAGDGTFLLRLARKRAPRRPQVEAVLVDRQPLVKAETKAAFAALGWEMETVSTDALTWLARPNGPPADLMIANLFLHHFPDEQLVELFRLVSDRTRLFLACEPRRSSLALQASRLLGLIGCNEVTRHDAVVSVRAGFVDQELSALWPERTRWHLQEEAAGLFSHCFVAQQR